MAATEASLPERAVPCLCRDCDRTARCLPSSSASSPHLTSSALQVSGGTLLVCYAVAGLSLRLGSYFQCLPAHARDWVTCYVVCRGLQGFARALTTEEKVQN